MNTLERNQIGAPDSRIEDSAFFCYISNLSPIKPVKPRHITETVNSLTFASVPPVFTSPRVKEWRILRRHNLPDLSKPDFCGNGDEANRLNTSVGVLDSVQVPDCSSLHLDQNKDEGASSSSLNSVGLQIFSADNGSVVGQGVSKEFKFGVNEEFNLSSPKKKKRKLEIFGESEACKRCSCKKSKCLKLYCECFAAGMYCMDSCSCQECFNKPIHEDTVMATRKQIESRNPLAFAPKVSKRSEPVQGIGDESNKTSSSKRGCNCKKSSCQKKYCECYQGGIGCSINCRCEGCKNEFGLNPSLAKDILALSDYRARGSGSQSVGLAGGVTSLPGISHFNSEAMYCSGATNSYFPKFSTLRAPIHCCTTSVPNCAVWEHSAAGVGALGGMPLEDAMWVDLVEGCNLGASQSENCNKLDRAVYICNNGS